MSLRRHITRRRLLAAGGAACGLAALDAFVVEPHWLDVSRLPHPIEGLPRSLDGFRIAQITDAHLTGLGTVEQSILDAVRRTSPQVIALTGDIIDSLDDGAVLSELCAELARTGATVIATLGNWEHWGHVDREALQRRYRASNTALAVDTWLDVEGLTIYASDDSTGGTPRAVRATPAHAEATVLLTHSPAFVDTAGSTFDLCLAGHTHGGQVTVGGLAPFTPPGSGRYVAGWYDSPAGPLYVSRGTGTSIVPARFTCRPELPLFELVRA